MISRSIGRRHPVHTVRVGCLLVLLTLTVMLAGCTTHHEPDLTGLYTDVSGQPKKHPLVIIPGTFGSRLNHEVTGENVWPDSLWSSWWGVGQDRLWLPLDFRPGRDRPNHLRPGRLQDRGFGHAYYARLVQTLEQLGGYDCVYPSQLSADSNCVILTWDWRRDFVHGARQLTQLVDRLRSIKQDDDLTVDVIGHSAAGLIIRYFVRYGPRDVLDSRPPDEVPMDGASRVNTAVLIGTPNRGSIRTLQRAIHGLDLGFNRLRSETLMRFPGLYHLLPHPDRTWGMTREGRAIDASLYDTATWKQYGWSIYDPAVRRRLRGRSGSPDAYHRHHGKLEAFMADSLERARRFHRSLSVPVSSPPVRYVVFGSACIPTPSRMLVERAGQDYRTRLFPDDRFPTGTAGLDRSRFVAPGDGSVTQASLLARNIEDTTARARLQSDFRVDQTVSICQNHGMYTSSSTFQSNLMNVLLNPGPDSTE